MPQNQSTHMLRNVTISFIGSSERVIGGVVWDIVDYRFRLSRGIQSCDVTVGIHADWQDRLSRSELLKLSETWLLHRLEHGYEPFTEPRRPRLTEVPFSVVNYWLEHRTLPH